MHVPLTPVEQPTMEVLLRMARCARRRRGFHIAQGRHALPTYLPGRDIACYDIESTWTGKSSCHQSQARELVPPVVVTANTPGSSGLQLIAEPGPRGCYQPSISPIQMSAAPLCTALDVYIPYGVLPVIQLPGTCSDQVRDAPGASVTAWRLTWNTLAYAQGKS